MKRKNAECVVCKKAEASYKCSKCRAPYCSVVCCKAHKEECSSELSTPPVNSLSSNTKIGVINEVELLSSEQLEALDRDQELQTLLRSERLAKHILQIDEATNRQGALKRLRATVPEFHSFCGTVLNVIEATRPKESKIDAATSKAKMEREEELRRLVIEAEAATTEAVTDSVDEDDKSSSSGSAAEDGDVLLHDESDS
jgi:zinc finger HIT domain-containing protein 3